MNRCFDPVLDKETEIKATDDSKKTSNQVLSDVVAHVDDAMKSVKETLNFMLHLLATSNY